MKKSLRTLMALYMPFWWNGLSLRAVGEKKLSERLVCSGSADDKRLSSSGVLS